LIIDWLFQNNRASRVFRPSQDNVIWKKREMDECKFMSGGEPGYGRKANG